MHYLKLIFVSFFISILAACSKAPDYSGTWTIDYGDTERTLTITNNGDEYQVKDESIKKEGDKTISLRDSKITLLGESTAIVNRKGELQYGKNNMVNKLTLNEATNQVTLKTYDHATIIFDKK